MYIYDTRREKEWIFGLYERASEVESYFISLESVFHIVMLAWNEIKVKLHCHYREKDIEKDKEIQFVYAKGKWRSDLVFKVEGF